MVVLASGISWNPQMSPPSKFHVTGNLTVAVSDCSHFPPADLLQNLPDFGDAVELASLSCAEEHVFKPKFSKIISRLERTLAAKNQ